MVSIVVQQFPRDAWRRFLKSRLLFYQLPLNNIIHNMSQRVWTEYNKTLFSYYWKYNENLHYLVIVEGGYILLPAKSPPVLESKHCCEFRGWIRWRNVGGQRYSAAYPPHDSRVALFPLFSTSWSATGSL